eukprot:TRINITY_DN94746_c0_g1_i1.p1 TRINITY_DN94746_c0_g1~~TRINITY_DN94746_c0_g1_i1.p1  ORF type:complete len:237 (+),score=48.53 TRINITY_DN94746_c0_g1_i1:83-793(+)
MEGNRNGQLRIRAMERHDASTLQQTLAGLDSSELDKILLEAVEYGSYSNQSLELVKCLLAHGASPNSKRQDDSMTPLHLAALDDKLDLAMVLMAAGADLDAQEENGLTPAELGRMQAGSDFAKGKSCKYSCSVATFLDHSANLPKYILTVHTSDTEDDGCSLACYNLAGDCQCQLKLNDETRKVIHIWNAIQRDLSEAGKLFEQTLVLLMPDGRDVLLVRDEELLTLLRRPQPEDA